MIPVLRRDRKGLPTCPVVKTPSFSAGSEYSVLGWEAKIPHVSEPENQNIKQKQYCNKFSKDIKMFFKKESGKYMNIHLS